MTTIYYVRHGQSEDNVAGVASGSERDAKLTGQGREQARATGEQLKAKQVDLIVCSPMNRAHETAEIIAEQIGYDKSRIVTNEDFTERFMGVYSGVPHAEYRKANEMGEPHPSLETTESMVKRVSNGLEWLKGHEAQNIVVVSHGGIGRAIKAVDQGIHHSELYKMPGFDNAEIYTFTI